MTSTQKPSIHRKPLSARQSCLISPNQLSLTAIMESGMGRSSNAKSESQNLSEARNVASSSLTHTGIDFQDHWDICCASACEFDRLKNHMDLTNDMDSLDYLFAHIYHRNDFPTYEDGVFGCDSEAGESLDSVSEGDSFNDTDGPQTPISHRKSPVTLYQWLSPLTPKAGIPSPPSSYPVTPLSSINSPSSSSICLSEPMSYLSSSKEHLSPNFEVIHTGSGISGLVEQLGPILKLG